MNAPIGRQKKIILLADCCNFHKKHVTMHIKFVHEYTK